MSSAMPLLEEARQLVAHLVVDLPQMLAWLDYAGVAVFAITGALVAARARQDVVTGCFFAVLTGMGGGTVRDLLIGAPVFWVSTRGYLEVALVSAVVVFLLSTDRWPERVLTWLDAVGLSVYCVLGTAKALSFDVPGVAAAAMGVITASVGGILRDVVAMRPSVLLDRELYVTAAIVGAAATVLLVQTTLPAWQAGTIAALAAMATRAGSMLYGWKQPEKRN
jgi:uncharacterized membrane protein YeiH